MAGEKARKLDDAYIFVSIMSYYNHWVALCCCVGRVRMPSL